VMPFSLASFDWRGPVAREDDAAVSA